MLFITVSSYALHQLIYYLSHFSISQRFIPANPSPDQTNGAQTTIEFPILKFDLCLLRDGMVAAVGRSA
jgi:hypothetical protein